MCTLRKINICDKKIAILEKEIEETEKRLKEEYNYEIRS
jgi:hypothetical protein